ncbi:hypothetical protein ACFY7V_32015 [[Kitasatospora] papulosa]|uniref:hypothetical protein n=1 Tax=Streptomyces TaxID=1883 RepID=UPI0004BD6E59|nr:MULTISPECIES: hypothetical protein [Streptomyces]MCY1649643.1 hypothetical protein [Streptomyces sp. SL203]MEE1775274.1 hypothetical protein [Streptomyces sp. JV181]MYT58046.1 hypothetical protein [Streptomyces sp. SID7834]WSZ46065.1 hypothetical protein OG337_01570 [[Kitasatospora] papulosa]
MRARTWQMIPSSRGISALYLVGGVLLALSAANQLTKEMAVLPLLSGLAAVALVITAVVGLVRPSSRSSAR